MARSLSVIIPSYNHGRFIAEAIESVAMQADEDLELVVVDDGSQDDSVEVIQSALADADIARVQFIQQSNAGAPAAIGRGVRAARGDLLAILNSDDSYAPNRFLRMRQEVPEEEDFFAFSMVRMVGEDNAVLDESDEASTGYKHALYESSRCPTVGYALLKINFAVTSGNFLFTRSLYEKIGGFREYELAHDWDFALRALYHVEPIFVPQRLLNYRTHARNARHGLQDRSVIEGRQILNNYLALCDESAPPNRLAPCEGNWPVYFDMFSSYHEPWFDRSPLRLHLDRPPGTRPKKVTVGWRPWAPAVDFHDVKGRAYLTDSGNLPAHIEALAVARSASVDAPDNVVGTYGSFADSLAGVVERQTGNAPQPRARIWPSPFFFAAARRTGRLRERGSEGPLQALYRNLSFDAKGVLKALFRRSLDSTNLYARLSEWKAYRAIQRSGIFELPFYQEQSSGARFLDENDAIRHYARFGAKAGLNPNPFFDTQYYFDENPDVAVSGINPLFHYLLFGEQESRRPHPKFDPPFYRALAGPDLDPSENLLAHYQRIGRKKGLQTSASNPAQEIYEGESITSPEIVDTPVPPGRMKRLGSLRRSLFFDANYYRSRAEAEFSSVGDAARHLVEEGALHGLAFLEPEELREQLWDLDISDGKGSELDYLSPIGEGGAKIPKVHVAIYVSSVGNAFHTEMARFLTYGFKELGVKVSQLDETTKPMDSATHSIVVAPHEYFQLGEGFKRCTPDFLERSHLFLAEQPGTAYFSKCLWFAYRSRGVLDLNPLVARLWAELGIHARALPLGYLEGHSPAVPGDEFGSSLSWNSLSPDARKWNGSVSDPLSERPIDIFFNGVLTRRREEFFAANAKTLASYESALFMPVPWIPIGDSASSALSEGVATAISQRSKIQLNVHRSELPYFEWHRNVIRSVRQKTLLLTETSYRVPGFKPGEHYFQCDLERMPAMLDWLLATRDGREAADRVRQNAFKAFQEIYPMSRILSRFLTDEAGDNT